MVGRGGGGGSISGKGEGGGEDKGKGGGEDVVRPEAMAVVVKLSTICIGIHTDLRTFILIYITSDRLKRRMSQQMIDRLMIQVCQPFESVKNLQYF